MWRSEPFLIRLLLCPFCGCSCVIFLRTFARCILIAQEREDAFIWYSSRFDFISTAVVADTDGLWQGAITFGQVEHTDQPYGLGPGKVRCAWNNKERTEVFSLVPLGISQKDHIQELQAEDELLKQQMASMQRLCDVTVARGSASASGSAATNWLQAGANLGLFFLSFFSFLPFLSMLALARTMVPPSPTVPAADQEPQAERQQWIKSGWMNERITLCGAIHKRDTDRLLERAQKTLGSFSFIFLW